MRHFFFLVLYLVFCSSKAQPLESWHTNLTENDPQAHLTLAGKRVAASPADAAGRLYAVGRCYHHLNKEDIALKYYMMAKKRFENLGMQPQAKDMALVVHTLISSQEKYSKYGNTFLDEYQKYAYSTKSHHRQARVLNEYAKEDITRYAETGNFKFLDSAAIKLTKGLLLSRNPSDITIELAILSNLAAVRLLRNDPAGARDYLKQHSGLLKKSTDKYAYFTNYYNYGLTYLDDENYNQAIFWLKKAENVKVPKFREKTLRTLYKKMALCYDMLEDDENRRKYQNLYTQLDNNIKDREQNIAIHDINVKYQVEEKDRQISALMKFKQTVQKNKLIFGISLFMVFLLALYSFIRWKKVDFRNRSLAREKEEIDNEKREVEALHSLTVEELETVRRTTTIEYIMVSNKKVFLAELMYMKAQDKYVDFYTVDGKKHTERKKISEVLTELPPNFIKVHRSFIINQNYIENVLKNSVLMTDKALIPISRNKKI